MAEKDRHLVWEALKTASRKIREEFPVDSDEGFEAMKRYAVEEYERLKEGSAYENS